MDTEKINVEALPNTGEPMAINVEFPGQVAPSEWQNVDGYRDAYLQALRHLTAADALEGSVAWVCCGPVQEGERVDHGESEYRIVPGTDGGLHVEPMSHAAATTFERATYRWQP